MPEHTVDPRWVAAANWAAAGGFGVGAIAEREGVTRIDAMLAIAEQWFRTPELFTSPPAATAPVGVAQCPDCGIWFSDVAAHRVVHQGAKPQRANDSSTGRVGHAARTTERPARLAGCNASRASSDSGRETRPVSRGLPLSDLPADAPWRSWAEAANWAAGHGAGPSRLADRIGTDAASVTVAIIDSWSRDPSAFTVPRPVEAPGGALKQCPACGLWFASVDNHVAAHGRISRRRLGSPSVSGRTVRSDHDGHAASRTAFELAMEQEGLLDHYLELRRAVEEHRSPPQFRTRIGVSDARAVAVVDRIAARDGYHEALGALLLSRRGRLEDDGDRVQCHLCGMWAAVLSAHVGDHAIDPAEYRRLFGLAPDDLLASRSMNPGGPVIGRLR